MNELDDEQIIKYIDERIAANKKFFADFGGDERFYEGANTALKELAIDLGLVDDYDYFEK
jgi:hypothetical protein